MSRRFFGERCPKSVIYASGGLSRGGAMTCKACGKPFEPHRRAHVYCCAQCRARDYLRRQGQAAQAREQQRDEELRVLALAAGQAIEAARQAIEMLERRLEDPH
jgi:hypothetical protein